MRASDREMLKFSQRELSKALLTVVKVIRIGWFSKAFDGEPFGKRAVDLLEEQLSALDEMLSELNSLIQHVKARKAD